MVKHKELTTFGSPSNHPSWLVFPWNTNPGNTISTSPTLLPDQNSEQGLMARILQWFQNFWPLFIQTLRTLGVWAFIPSWGYTIWLTVNFEKGRLASGPNLITQTLWKQCFSGWCQKGNQRHTPAGLERNSSHVVNCTWKPRGKVVSNVKELKEVPSQQLEGKWGPWTYSHKKLFLPITSDEGDNSHTHTIIRPG